MNFNALSYSAFVLTCSLSIVGCVSRPQSTEDSSSEVIGVEPVKPAQIGEDECVNYVQLERNAEYRCVLANGENRPMREGERRSAPLSREEIIEIIEGNSEDIDSCILSAERNDPGAKGKILINFEVEPDGKISDASHLSEKSTYKNETVAQCLISKIKSWRFPVLHNEDALEIKFPFTLGSESSTEESKSPTLNGGPTPETQSSAVAPQPNSQSGIPDKKTIKKTRKN